MKDQSLFHNENNSYLCIPLYNAGNGKLFAGRRVVISPKKTPPEIIIPSATNLCNVQTSGFIYQRPTFGCHGTSASQYGTRNKNVIDREVSDKKQTAQAKNFVTASSVFNEFRLLSAEKLPWIFARFASLPGIVAATSANMLIDMSAGYSFNHAAIAEIIGSAANIATTLFIYNVLNATIGSMNLGVLGTGIAGTVLPIGMLIAALIGGYAMNAWIVNEILNNKDEWDWNAE